MNFPEKDALPAPAAIGHAGPWPGPVSEAWARAITAALAPGEVTSLVRGWWSRGTALGGTVLLQRDPATGAARRWGETDRYGELHCIFAWESLAAERGVPAPLAWAAFRIPGGEWIVTEPGTGQHTLWGRSDRILLGGETQALLASQDWSRIGCIPALDRPSRLPPGAGEAVLNGLAQLAEDQGKVSLRYRGPYPTNHLFTALLRSFRAADGGERELRESFCRDEWPLALSGESADNPAGFAPDPWTPIAAAQGVLVRWRGSIESVWIDSVPFRKGPPEASLSAGERLWEIERQQKSLVKAGLILLGEPYRVFLILDGQGNILDDRRSNQEHAPETGAGLHPLLCEVVLAWCALRAPLPLASVVWRSRESSRIAWANLPFSLAERRGNFIRVQSGLKEQWRRLRETRALEDLALMLISDIATGALPHVLAFAAGELEAAARPGSPEEWLCAGQGAQREARKALARYTPELVGVLMQGENWDEP